MDRPSPPDRSTPPDSAQTPDADNMATMVATNSAQNMPGPQTGVSKRYRPAPPKTFQCRSFGECRMVFSRSEHLARHIRKHTGERPFSCHCSKQFSRLDNLRQHAQTVHADKQEQNERMMRDLTSLHATMAAANKVGGSRGGRRGGGGSSATDNSSPTDVVKQEDIQRPGTSTGYEGDMMYYDSSRPSGAGQSSFRAPGSFREPGQSFLVPPTSSAAGSSAQSHSFLGFPGTLNFIADARPGSSSRPSTSSGLTNDPHHPRSLPPLSAVVSATLPSPSQYHNHNSALPSLSSSSLAPAAQQQQSGQQPHTVLPFPLRRPSTATRPGTAPASASFFSAKSSYSERSGLGSSSGRPDLSLLHSGFGGGRTSSSGFGDQHHQHIQLGAPAESSSAAGEVPGSPGAYDSSPFYFHPPALDAAAATTTTSPSALNPRKRAFGGPDGPLDDASASGAPPLRERPSSSAGGLLGDYDYGSDSRPQSRRLSVMELCNDDALEQRPTSSYLRDRERDYATGSGAFLLSAATGSGSAAAHGGYAVPGGSASRPTTSSGLVNSTSSLHLFDRSPTSATAAAAQQSAQLFARIAHAAAGAAGAGVASASSPTSGGAAGQDFGGRGGGGVSAPAFSRVSSSATAPAPTSPGASSAASSSSPATPSFPPPPSLLSAASSSSSTYPSAYQRGGYGQQFQYQQQQQQQQQYQQQQQQQQQRAYQQQQQQHAQYQQFAHSPTFSAASASSGGSYSPRSPIGSDAGRSPFPAYAQHQQQQSRSPGLYGTPGDASDGGLQRAERGGDGQVRAASASVSPHPASFGMRA